MEETLGEKSEYALQEEQLGTAHAVQQAEELIGELGRHDNRRLRRYAAHPLGDDASTNCASQRNGAKATILTANADDPTGYGRIIRGEEGQVLRNVEQKDATAEEQKVTEINTGRIVLITVHYSKRLKKVKNDNAQGEYYLPDVIGILQSESARVSAYVTEDFSETLGVNDRVVLSEAESVMRRRIAEKHMRNGVTIINPDNTYISAAARNRTGYDSSTGNND